MDDFVEAEYTPRSKEEVLQVLNNLGEELRNEKERLDTEHPIFDRSRDDVREAVTDTIKQQFGENSKNESSLVDSRYLEICETGLPTEEELTALKSRLAAKVSEEWLREDVMLTSLAVGMFQQVNLSYWASNVRGVEDINLDEIPVFFHKHIPDTMTRNLLKISDDEILTAIKDGWEGIADEDKAVG